MPTQFSLGAGFLHLVGALPAVLRQPLLRGDAVGIAAPHVDARAVVAGRLRAAAKSGGNGQQKEAVDICVHKFRWSVEVEESDGEEEEIREPDYQIQKEVRWVVTWVGLLRVSSSMACARLMRSWWRNSWLLCST